MPSGTYYFEELKGVEGYEMDEASKRIEVIIPEFWVDAKGQPQYVVVNGQEMAELESGKVPVSAYESATPRVYNETVKKQRTNRKSRVVQAIQVNQENGPYSRKRMKQER